MAYLNIPEIYWDDETLNNDERVMLSIVHSYQGSCYWSISKWCDKFRQSKPTILGLIRSLEERGYLEAIRVNGKSTTYRILDQTGKKSLPVKKLDRTGKETLLVPVKNFDHTGKESLPYIYKYNNNHKESYNNSIVADAPLPNETELKDSLTDLDSVKEPFNTLEEPETLDVTHPPRDSAPPLPKKKTRTAPDWSQVQAAATPEQWASILQWQEHRKQLKKPCTPLSVMMKLNSLGSSLVASIENSIANCYQGIFPPRNHQLTADPAMVEKLMRELVDLSKAPELFHTAWQRIKPLQAFNYDGAAREEYRKQLLESPVGSKGYDIKLAQLKRTIERRTH